MTYLSDTLRISQHSERKLCENAAVRFAGILPYMWAHPKPMEIEAKNLLQLKCHEEEKRSLWLKNRIQDFRSRRRSPALEEGAKCRRS
jgi:hypothetical protein